MVLPVEVLSVLTGVVGLLPIVGVGSGLDLGYKGQAMGRHFAVGVRVVIIEEELDLFGGDLSPHLVVHQFKGNIVGVDIQDEPRQDG